MKIAIMQPYLFPYIGYFQLINAVDIFVIYDDVQYIKRGWINRNRILMNGEPTLFTFSVKGGSRNDRIEDKLFSSEFEKEKIKFQKTIQFAYKKAPYYSEVMEIIDRIMACEEVNLSRFITNQLYVLSDYFNFNTKFYVSSRLEKTVGLTSEEKLIDICKTLKADNYINPIGGIELYSKDSFMNKGITLSFLQSKISPYSQFNFTFSPFLSILDVMMFNPREKISNMIREYILI